MNLDKAAVEMQFEKLIATLDTVGMRTEVRNGRNKSILVFVRIRSAQKLVGEVYRSRFA
jgi:anoctamin-10